MEYVCHYRSPLGDLTLKSDGEALTGLDFSKRKSNDEVIEKAVPVFKEAFRWLDIYFSGKEPDFLPPLNIKTTSFGREVAELMLKIPYGQTVTYGELAKMIAERRGIGKMSAQAVGRAVGNNPIAIIVPCHRVMGKGGGLTGYGGGIGRKIRLLELEGVDTSEMSLPKHNRFSV